MERKRCLVCGQIFTPINGNSKYCSEICLNNGKRIRRKEWETRTGYLEKKRIYAQERRSAIKAAAEAERKIASHRKQPEQPQQRMTLQEHDIPESLLKLIQTAGTGGNITPEHWESFKEYDLQLADASRAISRTEVNGISILFDDFGQLVHDTIVQGHPIIVRVCHD
jgi:hypothetical protein